MIDQSAQGVSSGMAALFNFLLFLNVVATVYGKKSCYSDVQHPQKYFASKTAYDVVRGYSTKEITHEGCTPVQLYLMSRHGTRYPERDDIEKLESRLPELKTQILRRASEKKGKLCGKDIDNIREWTLNIPSSADENLAPAGEQEMQEIGRRYKLRFPLLLSEPYSAAVYDVRFTSTERTNSSARNFLIGAFGIEGQDIPFGEENVDNSLLRFYKKCKKWNKDVNKNPLAIPEVTSFNSGSKMEDVFEDVSERLGLKRQLSAVDVDLIYDMCRYEAAWERDKISPWCAAFKPDDLSVLEYSEDLKYYYKHGYGHSINYEQACPPIKEMIDHFRSAMGGNTTEPKALFRFSHSGMMLKVYARLGLFKDAKSLTAKNFKDQKDRKWRSSFMDAFSSNLAFTLLKCSDEYKILTYSQERELLLPGCSDWLCPIEEFLESYGEIAEKCNVEGTCAI